jgi:hypothetical protein
MRKEKAFLSGIIPALAGALVFVLAVTAFGDDTILEEPGKVIWAPQSPSAQQNPKAPDGGDTAGGTILRPSTTFGAAGDAILCHGGGLQQDNLTGPSTVSFGDDRKIRPLNLDSKEWHHVMTCNKDGNYYVAWQDNYFSYDYIQVYYSEDAGETWSSFGYVQNNSAHLQQPSIDVGTGGNGDKLVLAYIVDDGKGMPVPELAYADLSTHTFTTLSVPVWGWEGYAKPVVYTDHHGQVYWNTYLVCEGIVDSATNNINVCCWRSHDGGATIDISGVPLGNTNPYPWRDPDITYGTTEKNVFIVSYNENDYSLYVIDSDTFANSWNPEKAVATLSLLPKNPVDPEIDASTLLDNIMVCCTKSGGSSGGNDNIGYTYSKDAGVTWTTLYTLPGWEYHNEFAVSLWNNRWPGSFHLAFTSGQDHSVLYSRRPEDLSTLWQSKPDVVDDMRMAGSYDDFAKKGIACDWYDDTPCVAWSDARDNNPSDMDGYADFPDNTGLSLDETMVSGATGGQVNFHLNAGTSNAGRQYLLIGSMTGYEPGIPLPGGFVTLPVNYDIFTNLTITLANTAVFPNTMSTLDGSGQAMATMNLPTFSAGYVTLYFAFALSKPWDFASNAVAVYLVP